MASTVTADVRRPSRARRAAAAAALLGVLVVLAPVALFAGAANLPCTNTHPRGSTQLGATHAFWVATAYGPPWGGIQGGGVTATGINLSAGQPAYVIAVDPSILPLGSFEHVTPNPFGTSHAFYAGDTGGAITGRHIDIYDWQGRAAQNAWGKRAVTVTPAAASGAGDLLDEITPPATALAASTTGGTCASAPTVLPLTPGQTATILANGQAAAPADAPRQVQLAIAAGNQLIDKPYLYGGGHGQPLTELAAAFDCSSATSYILHGADLFGDFAETSGQLESYGDSGPGQWITVYANSAHAFIDIAGIVMDTAWYGLVQPTTPDSGPRWQPQSIIAAQYAGDQADGNGGFVQRHPKGL